MVLESGEEVGFSHCVVAVGSEGPVPARSTQVQPSDLSKSGQHRYSKGPVPALYFERPVTVQSAQVPSGTCYNPVNTGTAKDLSKTGQPRYSERPVTAWSTQVKRRT